MRHNCRRWSSKNITFRHSACQWRHSSAHCSLRCWWSLDNGSWCNGMRATSPALKRQRGTVEADRSKPVAVFQRQLNTVDEAVWSITAMWTRWWSSRAVVHYVVQYLFVSAYDPSLHWFHKCITVVAPCPVRATMSRYDKPASQKPTILPRSNALTCWYCALLCQWGIPALAFTFQHCLEALHWLSKA